MMLIARRSLTHRSLAHQTLAACACLVVLFSLAGCDLRQRMYDQEKYEAHEASAFFKDGMTSRLPIEGTVPRGGLRLDTHLYEGKVNGELATTLPATIELNRALLERGQERFNIYCTPCHGAGGDGKGITSKYGMVAVANFHDARLVSMTDGEIFNTITHGKNLMGPYGANIKIEDRWAIIAYLRALQRSRLSTMDDVPEPQKAAFQN